jgi:2,3-bisphosphoglycerate-dependent phosphoglycerate mutase
LRLEESGGHPGAEPLDGQSEWNARNLRTGTCVLIVSHGNTLRALIKHLDAIGDDKTTALNIPNGIPLLSHLGPDMRPLTRGGRYLDPQAARTGAAGPVTRAG